MSAEMIRETEYTSESSHAMHLAGTCKHCGNDTLMFISELNIHSCAFCHQETIEPGASTLSKYKPEPSHQHCSQLEELNIG
ncbi:hypothetical protein [Photobacterium kasasachensis]|uniref:hypothetical protein n=1 Tax=Photobacterium kasasachensis TaxID=2910240 RepID=UPI003D13DEA3